ncbi:hypothetical protein Tdes44962_MAKER02740 [Teratosphaeria destructans]|uniref:Mitochondrial carrier protein pet8 n=1 Tax=Teratosphaeria destructans TaxID=418781 RepID=A0A9W7SS67_9PEZI|nr:hypothetical protein Tdes44962_MAKER02740 [Teratosphaeria destructans]
MRSVLSPRALRVARLTSATRTVARPFTAAPRWQIKEDKDRSPEELERIKQEQLQKQKEGKGHWHEELASQSESHVAADREEVHDHDEHMEDLQKQTAGQSEKEHPHGKK